MSYIVMLTARKVYAPGPRHADYRTSRRSQRSPGKPEAPRYYLRNHSDAQPDQFTSTYYIGYLDEQGIFLTGNAGYVAAIKAGYFQVIAYNYQTTPAVDAVIARTLVTDPDYNLVAVIPNGNDTVRQYIWVKSSSAAP